MRSRSGWIKGEEKDRGKDMKEGERERLLGYPDRQAVAAVIHVLLILLD